MGQYTNKGLYNSYDKNNREREALDFYSTPTEEVYNILKTLNINFNNMTILEPRVGAGHMALGIEKYLQEKDSFGVSLIGIDIQNRSFESDNWN